jgi:hypothetical protein
LNKIFEWSPSQKRCYQRIKSGFKWHNGEILRFLTLGSSPNMKRDIEKSFIILVKRIKRLSPLKLYEDEYISKRQLNLQYKNNDLSSNLSFEYLKIKTNEGSQGVLHILYFGDFLPQHWIKDNWYDITGECKSAYISACKKGIYDEGKLSKYCIVQYCISQSKDQTSSNYVRYSWSIDWVYKGFVKDWEQLKQIHKHEEKSKVYRLWNNWLLLKFRYQRIFEVPLEDYL